MSSTEGTPTRYTTTLPPPPHNEWSPAATSTGRLSSLLAARLKDTPLGVDFGSSNTTDTADHRKTVHDAINILYRSAVSLPPPDFIKKNFAEALSLKLTLLAMLADAEQKCEDWEGALRQMLGEAEVQKISESVLANVDEDTMSGQYITATGRIRMRDFGFSRKLPSLSAHHSEVFPCIKYPVLSC